MSGQADFSWATTKDQVELYAEAEALEASPFVLSNENGCRKFVATKQGKSSSCPSLYNLLIM